MLIKYIDSSYVWKQVDLKWRAAHIRASWKIAFVELRDWSGFIQCIIEKNNIWEENFDEIKSCGMESVFEIYWEVSKHPKKDEYEIQVKEIKILQKTNNFPLWSKDDHWVEFLFDNRHLHLRSKKQRAIQRVRDTIIHSTYDRFRKNDYTKIDAPIFTPNACEWTTTLYEVEHTNWEKMYLSQSGQLYIEAAIQWHGRVYDFGPCFRAERTKTRRHLNELWMMDAETAFCDNDQNMKIQEELVYFIIQEVLRLNRKELEIIWRDISKLENIKIPFERKTHAEVVKELQAMWSDIWDRDDLWWDDEEMLMNKYDQPIFITNYPKEAKAFYMPEDENLPGTVRCSDMLAPEGYGEVIWGSERIWDYEILKKKIEEDPELNLEDWSRYLDLRKYGWVTTSGFGYWLERMVRWLCGLHHIRECIPFPRYHNRITP